MEKKKSKTNVNVRIDSDIWEQFIGLAKFLKIDRQELLENAAQDMIQKHQPEKNNDK